MFGRHLHSFRHGYGRMPSQAQDPQDTPLSETTTTHTRHAPRAPRREQTGDRINKGTQPSHETQVARRIKTNAVVHFARPFVGAELSIMLIHTEHRELPLWYMRSPQSQVKKRQKDQVPVINHHSPNQTSPTQTSHKKA